MPQWDSQSAAGRGQIGVCPPPFRPSCLQVMRKQEISIPSIGAHASLPGMADLSDFFSDAWQTIGRAIAMACISAGLREVPETISKTVKHRCQAELKRLGSLLRRLIFLMALHVQLAPVKPRLGTNNFEKTESEIFPRKLAGFIAVCRTCRLSGRPSACAVPAGGAGRHNRLRGRQCPSRRAGLPSRSLCGCVRGPAV